MRVLLVSTARQIGGAELYLVSLARALGDRCTFTVALSDHPAMAPLRADLAALAEVHPLPVDRLESLPQAALALRRLAASHHVMHLVSNHPASRLGIGLAFALRAAGPPLVIIEQRATPVADVRVPAALASVLPAAFRLSRRDAHVIAVSEENRRTLETVYGLPAASITRIYNGVDLARYATLPPQPDARRALGLPLDGPAIVAIARLLPNKGHRFLLDAGPTILARFPTACFVLAGDGDERSALEMQAASLGLASHVAFPGFRSDFETLVAAADVAVLSSLAEGFALSLIQALAGGLPVVATRVGGAAEVIEEGRNGFLVPPADAPAMALAVTRVLALSPAERAAFSIAARASAQRFSVEAMAGQTFALWQQVSAARARLS